MARSDLLISLVKAGNSGDRALFRRVVESLIVEERGKNHRVLAERLASELQQESATSPPALQQRSGAVDDLFAELTPTRTLDDLVLPEEARTACSELAEEHHRSELLRSYGLSPRHRVLLAGAPGNGKTSLAEALAHELMTPLIIVRYVGLIASYLGETAARLRRLFDYVKTRACVLFFDEFDTIGKERGDEHETGEIKRVVSSLLMQVDDLPSHVVVVTATNHPELLDRAVWRRFQVRLELPSPSRLQMQKFFELSSSRLDFKLGYTPRTLSEKLAGASFAELEEFVADVARRYVLSLPHEGTNGSAKSVVADRLKHWKKRYALKSTNGRAAKK